MLQGIKHSKGKKDDIALMGYKLWVQLFQVALGWKMSCKYMMFATTGGSSSQGEVLHGCWEIELI